MGFLSILAPSADAKARLLVREFALRSPATRADARAADRRGMEQQQEARQTLLSAVTDFQRAARLGLVGRIAFARAFQAELASQGYPAPLIRELTADVLARISFAVGKH